MFPAAVGKNIGHDKMRSGADLRIRSPLVSFNHVTDPHFVTFSSSLYTTIRNTNPNLTLILTRTLTQALILTLALALTLTVKLVINDPQLGPILIRKLSLF